MSSTMKTEYALSVLYETAVTGERNPVKYKIKYILPHIDLALTKWLKGIFPENISTQK